MARIRPAALMRDRPTWFRQFWPFDAGRRAVIADYVVIGAQHKHFLADVALMGSVYSPIVARNNREAAIAEGRRQMALEILAMCRARPELLFEMIAEKPARVERAA